MMDGLRYVRGPLRGHRVHFQAEGKDLTDTALCGTSPGLQGWAVIAGREAIPEPMLCPKCVTHRAARERSAARREVTQGKDALYRLREKCVAEGHLRARDSHRPAHVRLADAEARWENRTRPSQRVRLSGHTSR